MLPLAGNSELAANVHILLTYISLILFLLINKILYNIKYNITTAINIMKGLYIYIYDDKNAAVHPLRAKEKEIAVLLGLDLDSPVPVELKKDYKSAYLRSLHNSGRRGRPKGSKNKAKIQPNVSTSLNAPLRSRRGRPKDSKNMP